MTPKMRWAHLIFGIVLFLVFTQTGSFMRADFPDKDAIPQDFRLLMRSRHIYILFSALIHMALGAYLQMNPHWWRRVMQYAGSLLLTAASVLLVWAFITETYTLQTYSDFSRNGIYLSLAGTGLNLIGGINLASSSSRMRA